MLAVHSFGYIVLIFLSTFWDSIFHHPNGKIYFKQHHIDDGSFVVTVSPSTKVVSVQALEQQSL
jgi:hypothetical protein